MLRIGIIGCGKIAEVRHAPEYHENPDSELVAYYDLDPRRAALLAEQFGGRVHGSIGELLASGVEAVSVCVANAMHAEVTVAALEAGAHVLCEKPMATTPQGCRAMLAAADRTGRRLMVGLNQRFAKAHQRAKEILDSGELGQLLTFRTNFCHPGPEGWTGRPDSWFFDRRMAAFGVMADLGVHKTDLIHYLTGQRVVATSAVVATLDKKLPDGLPVGVDDNAYAIYTMESGALGTMNVSWTDYGSEDNSTRIYCTGGVLRLYDDPEYSLIVETPDRIDRYALDRLTSNKEQTSGGRTSTGVIDAFVASVLNDTPSIVGGAPPRPPQGGVVAQERSSERGRPGARAAEGELS